MFRQRIKSSKSLTQCWQPYCENVPQTTGNLFSEALLLYLLLRCSFCIYLLLKCADWGSWVGPWRSMRGSDEGRGLGVDMRLSHQEPRELVRERKSSTQGCLVIPWMKIHGTYLQFFSLPCISFGTVVWTQPSHSAMIHPGYSSKWLILSKDGSEAHRGQTLIQRLMTLIWELRLNTIPCEAVGRWLGEDDGPLLHGHYAGQEVKPSRRVLFQMPC